MRNFFCTLSYLGHSYHGFERQKQYKTVQGEIERALSELIGVPSQIHGAGRTDAGVNAKGQTFSFFADKDLMKSKDRFLYSFNRLLPSDISVLSLAEVPLGFDARHSCSGKRYSYSFSIGPKDPYKAFTVACLGIRPFDYDSFSSSLSSCIGLHDFRDFTTKPDDKDDFCRDIKKIDITYEEISPSSKETHITFVSNGFMTYQVRIMVGAALKVGLGKLSVSDYVKHLSPLTRSIISFKAPAEGLTLEEVYYE